MKLLFFLFAVLCGGLFSISVEAASFVVTRSDDRNNAACAPGDCSLREAVRAANAAPTDDAIEFAAGISLIVLSDELFISNNGSLTIQGTGANALRIDGGTGSTAVFYIEMATVSIADMSITGGGNGSFYDGGGAIYVNQGSLSLNRIHAYNNLTAGAGGAVYYYFGTNHRIRNSTFSTNQATNCGAVFNDRGNLSIVNTTFSGNIALSVGGALCTEGTTRVRNITVSGNTAELGGGLHFGLGEFSFGNSIIAGNTATKAYPEMFIDANNLVFAGHNLVGDSPGDSAQTGVPINYPPTDLRDLPPLLGPLQNNGGTTPTRALLTGSPAINAGNNARAFDPFDNSPLTTDQRGYAPRLAGGTVDIGAFEFGAAANDARRGAFDFDGDGKTDVSIFRSNGASGAEWWYQKSSAGQTNAFQFGSSADKPVPADFTGDGRTDIAFWRPASGEWFILRSEDGSFYAFPFGAAGDLPIVGDFDADGRADAGVFRPSAATWFIQKSTGGTIIRQFGAPGDKPVVGDYDGDSRADLAIYRDNGGASEWWIARSSDNQTAALRFGLSTDKAVPADYTGDGKTDVAFFRPATGEWFVLRSEDGSFYAFPFGGAGDVAAPGDYDGDGRADAAVFRPSAATWFVQHSGGGTLITGFGTNGDAPVPGVFVP